MTRIERKMNRIPSPRGRPRRRWRRAVDRGEPPPEEMGRAAPPRGRAIAAAWKERERGDWGEIGTSMREKTKIWRRATAWRLREKGCVIGREKKMGGHGARESASCPMAMGNEAIEDSSSSNLFPVAPPISLQITAH
jgi:hypothetical protein